MLEAPLRSLFIAPLNSAALPKKSILHPLSMSEALYLFNSELFFGIRGIIKIFFQIFPEPCNYAV